MLTRLQFLGVLTALAAEISVNSCTSRQGKAPLVMADRAAVTGPDYDAWGKVLQAHIKPTTLRGIAVNAVDYDGIRSDPNFDIFVQSLETAPTTGGKAEEYALWINSYNALAIKTVIDNPCKKQLLGMKKTKIASIKDVGTVLHPVWKRPAGVVGGETLSLDDIENVKLRTPEGYPADPLLHACIVCASASCPDVALTVYKPETLEDDMAANMRDFLANKKKGLALDKGKGVITLSKVFQWFEGDFMKAGHASVLDALMPFMPEDVCDYVRQNKESLRVAHFEYDWGLNGPSPGAPGKGGSC